MTNDNDPRSLYAPALTWATELISAVRPDQLENPTPCTEFDVRALLGHLVATVERARVIGESGDFSAVPVVVTGVADDGWGAAYAAAVDKLWSIWSDDALLDRTLTAPWGTTPGRAMVWGYLNETLVHGWDLAVATGQPVEADPALAEPVLMAVRSFIPAEPRGGHMPFEAVVESSPDAGPTERLANWSGHRAG